MQSGIRPHGKGVKGLVDRALARHLERIIAIPGSRLRRRFVRAARDAEATQRAVLEEILSYARGTEYGERHGFAKVRNHADWCERVPVCDYEDVRPYVDRHARGERNVLFPEKPIMYNRSSGTTAEPKLIPVTPYNFERTIKDRSKLWLYGLSRDFPGIYGGRDLTVVSTAVEGHTEDGTPFGSLSGFIYRNIPEFMNAVHAVPASTIDIADYDAKTYVLLRFALASDVTLVLTGNPATVLNLVTRADAWKERLVRDIRDGAIDPGIDLESGIRAECQALLRPAPERAAHLDRIASAGDAFRPADYWPNLRLIHTWKNGNCRLVIPKLAPWFRKETPILDFGYIASEITATDLIDPATDGSILQVLSGFYEFGRVEEGDRPSEYLMAHQLEEGERYFIYVTTFSGLYRYDMNDVVEVVGRFGTTPVVRFLYKGKGVTSIQGEKLSEQQLIEAVRRASERTGAKHDFFVGWADADASRYRLYIEILGDGPEGGDAALARAVDAALCEVNVEYEAKRESDRLGEVEILRLCEGAFHRYREIRLDEGAHEGQLKWLHLSATEATRQRMERLVEKERPT